MGSQAVWNAEHEAPVSIAVRVNGEWFVAEREGAEQPDNYGGGRGPVVVCYATRGRHYARGKKAAIEDAVLALKRSERL